MKKLTLVLVGLVFLGSVAFVDEVPFANKAWKKYSENSLNFSIYLPKKFKKSQSSSPDMMIYSRKNPNIVVGVMRYSDPIGPMSKADAIAFVDELHYELWLDSSINYLKVYDPTLITNYAGQNGFHWMFMEMGPGLKDYYWTFDCYFDADGYLYTIMCLGDLDMSPNVGAGITFCMENGVMSSLLKPMAVPPDASVAAQNVATAIREFRKEMAGTISDDR